MTPTISTADPAAPAGPPGPVADQVLDLAGLQRLLDVLVGRGFTVLGPTVRDGAVVTAPLTRVEELPRGWGDDQEAGHYRLRRRDDDALFGFAAVPSAAKPVFFPAEERLWAGRRAGRSFTTEPDGDVPTEPEGDVSTAAGGPPYALLGLRACDLAGLAIHDTVLTGRGFADVHYARRREDAFVVAVTCSTPAGTCFCVSMGTGPRPAPGAPYDLALTELLADATGPHRFLVATGSPRGAEILAAAGAQPASGADVAAADAVATAAAARMGRTLDTEGLPDLLHAAADSPVWDEVASRCLACGNCTAVCPTCFCTTVADHTDLTGDTAARDRVWDSCFNAEFSYIHGGTVRTSTRSRHRQWATHKLASWVEQFGTSGCVGCGRCITWCPVGIDITATAAAIRAAARPAGAAPPAAQPPPRLPEGD